jgi:hypothetical protein
MTEQSRQETPKVFISHATADKDRFVLTFAARLRNNGVDAWVDQWEMNPGDSLVEKIFEQGLKDAQAMIVVLSNHSIKSKWVREELNVAMVQKIEKSTKLIPVRLDSCDVPECLRATIREDIVDLVAYEPQFRRILNAIHGQYERPPLGDAPVYLRSKSLPMAGLSRVDSLILESLCRKTIETNCLVVDTASVKPTLTELGITDEDIAESQEILRGRGYVEVQFAFQQTVACSFQITTHGFEQFARIAVANYSGLIDDVARHIANGENLDDRSIAKATNQPTRIIGHIIGVLSSRGLVRCVSEKGVGFSLLRVFWVSPELCRTLR